MNFTFDKLTAHALKRYIERRFDFDWTDLEIQYMLDEGLISINHIKDSKFISWVDKHFSLSIFRQELKKEFLSNPERFVLNKTTNKVVTYIPNKLEVYHE